MFKNKIANEYVKVVVNLIGNMSNLIKWFHYTEIFHHHHINAKNNAAKHRGLSKVNYYHITWKYIWSEKVYKSFHLIIFYYGIHELLNFQRNIKRKQASKHSKRTTCHSQVLVGGQDVWEFFFLLNLSFIEKSCKISNYKT